MKSCQKCIHADVCYMSKTIVEMIQMEQGMFPVTRYAVQSALDGMGKHCKEFKDRNEK